MDGDVTRDSSAPTVSEVTGTEGRAKIYYLGTAGHLLDPRITAEVRERLIAAFGGSGENIAVLDLGGAVFSPGSLQELLLPLARRVRAGEAGALNLVVIAEDRGVADFVRMLAAVHGLSLYVTDSPERVVEAEPVGRLTPTDKETIDALAALGGRATVSTFAHQMQMQITAAGNRLTNLSHRGYLHREQRSRREGDQFIDPRSEAYREVLRYYRKDDPHRRQPPR
ncbi:hypothetical protein ACWEEK_24095 [Micromonospora aurantiaca (nom. illeg.)]